MMHRWIAWLAVSSCLYRALVGFVMALKPLSSRLYELAQLKRQRRGNNACTIPFPFSAFSKLQNCYKLINIWRLTVAQCTSSKAESSWPLAGAHDAAAEGLQTTGFNASLGEFIPHKPIPNYPACWLSASKGFWFLFMGLPCVAFLTCSLKIIEPKPDFTKATSAKGR
ncbi:hypothetical protein V8C37DRAFT_71209 [Trichoderma ceciliae]